MKKQLIVTLMALLTISITVNATINTNPTQTKQCEKCGTDGKGGAKCAPGKCGKGK